MPTFLKKWGIATVSKKTYIGVGVTAGIPVIGAAKQLIDARRAIGKSKHRVEMTEMAAGRKIDDLQIISTKDPNIKEIVGTMR